MKTKSQIIREFAKKRGLKVIDLKMKRSKSPHLKAKVKVVAIRAIGDRGKDKTSLNLGGKYIAETARKYFEDKK